MPRAVCDGAYLPFACAGLFACATLLVVGVARADLPRAGIYTTSLRSTAGSQGLDRLVVAVDARDQTVKVLLPGRAPRPVDGAPVGAGHAPDAGPPCAAYGAQYYHPRDAVLRSSAVDDVAFCKAEIDVGPASVTLKIPSSNPPLFNGTELSIQLSEPRSYVDIVRLPRQAYFYRAPDASKRTAAYVVTGDYVAVLRKAADWFLVDYFGPRTETQGWIRHEDLVQGDWIEQSAKTPLYSFAVACEADDDRIHVNAVEVRDLASGRPTQVFYDIGSNYRGTCKDVVGLEDANFDGYPDIAVEQQDGGAGPNYTNDYYLYNPGRRLFEANEALSNLVQPVVDPVKREIRAGARNGAMEHESERYHFAGGRLILIESELETCGVVQDDPGQCDVTTRRLVRGAYVVTKTKRRVAF